MTPQILPTETKETLIAGQYTKSEWLQLTQTERREISYNRYLQNVAKAPKVNYDSFILSALYEIIYYISNGLFEAFSVVKGDVTANVTIKDENDFVVQIQTPTQYFQICDDKDLFFTKLNVKTFEKLVGAKTAKLLKAELPTETVSTTNEVFEISKSSCKKLSAIQVKTYSTPKEYKAIYSNTSHQYWTINISSNNEIFFKPVNAVDFKINLEYFAGFEFFYFESRDFVTVTEKTTGMVIVKNYKNESMNEKLFKISENQKPFAEIIANSTKKQPFTIEPNESIESINQKRIAQNEIYVFGTTPEVEPITETQPETNEENEVVENEIESETNQEPQNQTETMTIQPTQPQKGQRVTRNGENGTIVSVEKNRVQVNFDGGFASLLRYDEFELLQPTQPQINEASILEAKIKKAEKLVQVLANIKNPLTHARTDRYYYVLRIYQSLKAKLNDLRSALQPQTLTVGQAIQCDGYRLVVTAVKQAKNEVEPSQDEPVEQPAQEPIKPKSNMNFYPTTEKVTVENYPYGYTQRTTAFYSIEFKKGFGFRKVFQTVNPKTGRLNNPKNGSYHTAVLLNKNEENGHIESYALSFNGSKEINSGCKFMAINFDLFTPEQIKYIYKELYTYIKADFQALCTYCGANPETSICEYKDALNNAAKGFNTGENVFSEITLDIQAIEALKVPDFQPFKITRYERIA
jgi:hypothetical protein